MAGNGDPTKGRPPPALEKDMQGPSPGAPSPDLHPPAESEQRWRKALPWVVVIAGACFTAGLLTLARPGIFFSGDAGLKMLLVDQFAGGDLGPDLHFDIPPPTAELWANGYLPFRPPFAYQLGGRIFAWCPLLFEYLTAPAYALLGWRGMYFWPVVGLALTWLVLWRQGRRLALGPAWTAVALFALIFCSPLTLYGAIYWEHTLAVALAMIGLELLASPALASRTWNGLLAGLAVGLTFWLRSEMLWLLVSISAVVALGGPLRLRLEGRLPFLGGVALAGAALVAWNLAVYGDPTGLTYRPAEAGLPTGLEGIQWRLNGLAWIVPSLLRLLAERGAVVALAVAAAVTALALRWDDEGRRAELRFWGVAAVAFVVGLPLILPNAQGGNGGKQLGPRYLLLVFPIAALTLATAGRALWQRTGVAGRALLGVALLGGGALGVRTNAWEGAAELAEDYATRIAPVADVIRADPSRSLVVLDPLRSLEFVSLLPGKQIYLAESVEALTRLAASLAEQGEPRLLLLTDEEELEGAMPTPAGRVQIGRVGCYGRLGWCLSDVTLYPVAARAPGGPRR